MLSIVAVADAVVTELNNEGWSLDFVAQRFYRPRFEVADLKNLQVSVVPRSMVLEAASRRRDMDQYEIDIAIQQKLSEEATEEIDSLVRLVDEIARYFHMRRLATLHEAMCTKVEVDPLYAVEHLDDFRCFTSVIKLTFRGIT